jgi:predicted Zn-dependent protease
MTMPPVSPYSPYSPMDSVERYHEAWRLLEEHQPRDAIAVLDPAVEEEPQSTSLRTLRAWAYFQSAHLTGAEADLRMIVEERPTDVWARFALGRTLERQSRLADALPHLRLAAVMSGDPEHETAVLRVERRLAERGERSFDDLTG